MVLRESAGRIGDEIPRLLRIHARTMAISLGLLPRPLREPLGLAYLLARASDTLADSGIMGSGERIAGLEGLAAAIAGNGAGVPAPKQPEGLSGGEETLLSALPRLYALFARSRDRDEIAGLWQEILEGQLFDLRRFVPGSPPLGRVELGHYCDLVAGSVGRCWTRLIARHAPGTLLAPVDQLMPLASAYGRGLQLLNILRDRHADGIIGRKYVAEAEMAELLEVTRGWLRAGDRYLSAVAPGRILMATALPLDLAKATLPLIAAAPAGTKAKLSRCAVRRALGTGVFSLVLRRRFDPV